MAGQMDDGAMPGPIVFTDEVLERARKTERPGLLLKWAQCQAAPAPALRDQIERAAAIVPVAKRPRVLGSLLGKSSSDDQVRSALGVLLLGKTLRDQGWAVEFEPEEAGGTPDLRIVKGDAGFLVEVRRIAEAPLNPSRQDIERVKEALKGITTRTPIRLRNIHIPGGASLKPFRKQMATRLAAGLPPGPTNFHEDGVFVGFDVLQGLPETVSAVVGAIHHPVFGEPHDAIRDALNKKLLRYKTPLIVALDFFDFDDAFRLVEEVLVGREVIEIPIDVGGGGSAQPPSVSRAADGMLVRRGADGDRVRSRLLAALPFGLRLTAESGFEVRGGILSNPAFDEPSRLAVPRLVVVEQSAGVRRLQYLDERDQPLLPAALTAWTYTP